MQVKFAWLFLLLLARVFIVRYPDANASSLNECRLSSRVVSEIVDPYSRTWTVDDAFLNANQLQDVLDCAKEGDTVALKVSKTIRLEGALVVKKKIIIKSAEVNAKATMTCPLNDAFLFIENANAVLENIIIQDCQFHARRELKSTVKLKCDEMEDETFMFTLLNVDFMDGDKSRGLTGIDVEYSECFSVAEKKIEHHQRGLQSTHLYSEEARDYGSVLRDSQVNHNRITLNVENQACSINYYLTKDKTECVECERDQYNFHPDNETCKACPKNADCSEEYVLPLPGHWNSMPCSKHVQGCPNEDACRGQDPSSLKETIFVRDPFTCRLSEEDIKKYRDSQCADGYQDLLCGSCKDDYGKIGPHDCVSCRNRVLTMFSLILATSLLIYSAWEQIAASLEFINARLLTRLERPIPEEREANVQQAFQLLDAPEEHIKKAQNAKTKFAIVLQIFVNFMQLLGAALSLNRNWSKSVNRLLDASNWISQNVSQVYTFSFECLLPAHGLMNRSFLSNLLAIFAPFLIIAIILMYWLYEIFYFKMPWEHFVRRGTLSALSILNVSFYSLTISICFLGRTIRVFDAIALNEVDASHVYWLGDTSIKGRWTGYGIVALLLYISYGLFVFFCYVAILFDVFVGSKINPTISEEVRGTYGVLIFGFKDEYMFWEFLISMRKFASAILFFIAHSINRLVGGIIMTVVLIWSLYLHLNHLPYRTDVSHLNFLEGISLFVCGLTAMICTMLARRSLSSSIARPILISIITFSSILALIIFGYHLATSKFIEIKYTLLVEGVVNEDDSAIIVILKYWRAKLIDIMNFFGKITMAFRSCFNQHASEIDNEGPSTSLISSSNT